MHLDSVVAVYDAGKTGDCSHLVHVACSDDDDKDDCGTEAGTAWFAHKDRWYYILVTGYGIDAVGTFGLSILPRPTNQAFCRRALEVKERDIDRAKDFHGWTYGASLINNVNQCDNVRFRAPGVFYKLKGKGRHVTASTCFGPYDFDTKISVYKAPEDDCENSVLQPIAGACNDDACSSHRSRVSWFGVNDQWYYVIVHGYSDEGRFQLRFYYWDPVNVSSPK